MAATIYTFSLIMINMLHKADISQVSSINNRAITLMLRDSSCSITFFLCDIKAAVWQNGRYGSEGAWSGTEWSARNVRKRNGTWTVSFGLRKICGWLLVVPVLNSCSSTGVVMSFNILKYRHSRASCITLKQTEWTHSNATRLQHLNFLHNTHTFCNRTS